MPRKANRGRRIAVAPRTGDDQTLVADVARVRSTNASLRQGPIVVFHMATATTTTGAAGGVLCGAKGDTQN